MLRPAKFHFLQSRFSVIAYSPVLMVSNVGAPQHPPVVSNAGVLQPAAGGMLLALVSGLVILSFNLIVRRSRRPMPSQRRARTSLLPSQRFGLMPPTHHEMLHDQGYLNQILEADLEVRQSEKGGNGEVKTSNLSSVGSAEKASAELP